MVPYIVPRRQENGVVWCVVWCGMHHLGRETSMTTRMTGPGLRGHIPFSVLCAQIIYIVADW